MNTEILKKQFRLSNLFILLFGLLGWAVAGAFIFYLLAVIYTPAQLCGYYLDHEGSNYKIKAYWKFGTDSIVYRTYNGKEAIQVLKELNEQFSPLKPQPQKSKDI